MRDYGRISPMFWTRGTGKNLRGDPMTQVIALYLMSAPSSNMAGVYYLPLVSIQHDLGCSAEAVKKGLDRLSSEGYCLYDEEHEVVFVRTMAGRQLGSDHGQNLSEHDKRRHGVVKQLKECSSAIILQAFYDEYKGMLHLTDPWWEAPSKPIPNAKRDAGSPFEAPSKPLRWGIAQDQDQDQDQESSKDDSSMSAARTKSYPDCFEEWWLAYPKQLRVGKGKTYSAYQKAGKDLVASGKTKSEVVKFLLERVKEFAASNRGKRTDLSLNPATWLSQGRYDDAPEAWQLVSSNGHATTTEDDMPTNYAYYPKEGVAK